MRETKGRKLKLSAVGLGLGGAPVASEFRWMRPERHPTRRWTDVPVARRDSTRLGFSFRPLQAEALGLDPGAALDELLTYPVQVVRLGAYWDQIEPAPGQLRFDELDGQVEAAERAGKQIIVCVGAVKTFGYPECFVPNHYLAVPIAERSLVEPSTHPALFEGATAFVGAVVERYRDRPGIVAWQVEHEAVDPLGIEHSWRLSTPFVGGEVDAVRAADPTRPIVMNGFLPTSVPVRAQQWWRTRPQGDSLAVAEQLADVVGIDFYPRHGLMTVAGRTVYLDGSRRAWEAGRRRRLFARAADAGRHVMIAEGQAEPWEAVTVPPSPDDRVMYSCRPEQVIGNYNQCVQWGAGLWAYLFWGAEYWLRRRADGDPSYMEAFARVVNES